jgi:formylglycine-generating enzyme
MATDQTPISRRCFLEPELVTIPGAWFLMGSESGQDNERPVHTVWVDTFLLAKRQVTNAEYALFLNDTGSAQPACWTDPDFNHPQQPVVAVSWFDAAYYCEWLSDACGNLYRLPSEAEWEYAARGGLQGKLFPWGDDPPQARPGYAERWQQGPERVGLSSPNAFGLYEMCENVHEWCSDWFDPGYYRQSPDHNPPGPAAGTRKSSRGGSWRHHVKISRCAARSSIPPEFQYADYGFRVACHSSRG